MSFTEDSVRQAVARITPNITKSELKLLQLVSTCVLDEAVYSTDSLAALHEMLMNKYNFHDACIALKQMLTVVGVPPKQVDKLPGDPNEIKLPYMSFFTMIIGFIKKLGPDWKKAAEEFIDQGQSTGVELSLNISVKNIDSPAGLFQHLIKADLIKPHDEIGAQDFLNKKLKKYVDRSWLQTFKNHLLEAVCALLSVLFFFGFIATIPFVVIGQTAVSEKVNHYLMERYLDSNMVILAETNSIFTKSVTVTERVALGDFNHTVDIYSVNSKCHVMKSSWDTYSIQGHNLTDINGTKFQNPLFQYLLPGSYMQFEICGSSNNASLQTLEHIRLVVIKSLNEAVKFNPRHIPYFDETIWLDRTNRTNCTNLRVNISVGDHDYYTPFFLLTPLNFGNRTEIWYNASTIKQYINLNDSDSKRYKLSRKDQSCYFNLKYNPSFKNNDWCVVADIHAVNSSKYSRYMHIEVEFVPTLSLDTHTLHYLYGASVTCCVLAVAFFLCMWIRRSSCCRECSGNYSPLSQTDLM